MTKIFILLLGWIIFDIGNRPHADGTPKKAMCIYLRDNDNDISRQIPITSVIGIVLIAISVIVSIMTWI